MGCWHAESGHEAIVVACLCLFENRTHGGLCDAALFHARQRSAQQICSDGETWNSRRRKECHFNLELRSHGRGGCCEMSAWGRCVGRSYGTGQRRVTFLMLQIAGKASEEESQPAGKQHRAPPTRCPGVLSTDVLCMPMLNPSADMGPHTPAGFTPLRPTTFQISPRCHSRPHRA